MHILRVMQTQRAHRRRALFPLLAVLVPLCACAEEDAVGPPPPPPPPPPAALTSGPLPPSGAGMMVHAGLTPGLCLDAEDNVAAPHTPVLLSGCHGRENQRWNVSPEPTGAAMITGIGGLCLDVRGRRPGLGSTTQLFGCNGGGNQRFRYEPDGHIRELATGLCLTATSMSVGAAVVSLPCEARNPGQSWVMDR
jgi:hypothetical protein